MLRKGSSHNIWQSQRMRNDPRKLEINLVPMPGFILMRVFAQKYTFSSSGEARCTQRRVLSTRATSPKPTGREKLFAAFQASVNFPRASGVNLQKLLLLCLHSPLSAQTEESSNHPHERHESASYPYKLHLQYGPATKGHR